MRKPLKRLLKHPSIKHRSIFVFICTGLDMLAYDNDAPDSKIVQELQGIKKHCEGLLAEKLAEAVTGQPITPPPRRKRTHKSNNTRKHKLAAATS
jgi:hypothetical protein